MIQLSDRMLKSTGLLRDPLDQFYTNVDVARSCVDLLKGIAPLNVPWIEPSAGTGAFLQHVTNAVGYDIDPKHPRVQRANFLETTIPQGCVVFGNPPFGRQSSLAKKFIQYASIKADWIAFILPRSFEKPSMQKAFPPTFHLLLSNNLAADSFIVNGEPYDVPCVFQIWKREETQREVEASLPPIGFAFVKKTDPYTLAFRRVGVNAGKCSLPADVSEQSHYFIRLEDDKKKDTAIAASHQHVFPSNTTGPRSLSKREATQFLNAAIAAAAN